MIRQNSNPSKEQQKEFKKLLPLFQDFGFGPEYVWDAFKFTNGNPNEMLNLLVEQSKVNNEINQKLSQSKNPDSEQNQIKEAIKQSLQQQQKEDIQNPEELIRKPEFPVGLQNLGQTCYFNVVIQTLFQIREVRDLILKIDFDQIKHELYPLNKQKKFKLLKEFQILFGMMLKGKKSYTIPLELFEAFKSINDNVFKIGEQADFFEFQNTCFELIEEAFDTEDQQQIEQKQKQENTDQGLNNGFNQSILKKSQIQEKLKNNKNPITKLFYGVSQEVIQFYNNQQAEIKKYQEQIQGIVNLDVKLGDLYKSFANSQKIVIDEYQTKDGNKTSAQIETKIKTPPYILNFYINRMNFNRKTLQPEKDQGKFYFPKEMFLDLFMQQESEQNQQNSIDNLQMIERKIQKLEEVLQNWEEYGEYNLKLEHCFTNVLNFLKLQRENEEEFTNLEESELGIDELEGKFGVLGNVNDFKTTINTVQNYHDQLKNKKQKLQEKLKTLKEQKKKMYEQNQNQKYELFSILMHDGEAMSGHYYCYILDDKTGEWWKFNDRIVTKANEQEIFEEAYGNGNSKKNACCLFYRNTKEKIKNTQPVTLTARLKQEIVKRDRQFLEDIDITRVQNGLEGLKINMGQIIKRHQKILDSPNKSFFEKFADFDRFLLNEESFKKFSNYSIFSKLLKNANTDQVLEVLNQKQNLEKGIQIFVKKTFGAQYLFQQENLKEKEEQLYEELKKLHSDLINIVKKMNFEQKQLVFKSDDMETNLYQLIQIKQQYKNLNQQLLSETEFGFKMQQYTNQLIQQYLLKACFVLDLRFQKKKIENTQNLFDLILLITYAYYSQDLLLFQQVQANLNFTVLINKEKNMDYFRKQLDQFYPNNKLKIDQAQKFVRECEYKQCDQNIIIPTLVDEIEAKIEKENAKLQVWTNFLDELRKNKKLIDQTKRLNIEEVLYFSEE